MCPAPRGPTVPGTWFQKCVGVAAAAMSCSTASRTQQLARWSFTTPHACIAAQTVVGPTKRKPAAFSRLESSFDAGVCASQSAALRGGS